MHFRGDSILTMLGTKPRYARKSITTAGVSMDLQFTPEEEAFRLKVRSWLAENMPTSGLSADREGRDDKTWLTRAKAWQRRLHDAGYVALAWPKEYGGEEQASRARDIAIGEDV